MESRGVIIILLALSISAVCQSSNAGQPLTLCDISKLPTTPIEVTTEREGVNFGPYLVVVLHEIKQNWYQLIPPAAQLPLLKTGCVVVEFKILKDGSISGEAYQSTSGDASFDRAAWGAVSASSPLLALPPVYKRDYLGIRIRFLYNPQSRRTANSLLFPAPNPVTAAAEDTKPGLRADHALPATTLGLGPSSQQSETVEIIPGRLLGGVVPKYPKESQKEKIAGRVVLQATIEASGDVSAISIVEGDLALAEAAVDVVRNWRFEPYVQNGVRVKVHQRINLDFIRGKKEAQLEPFPSPSLQNSTDETSSTPGGVYRVGRGVTAPKAIYSPSPAYDDKARKAKYQGVCILALIVGADGQPHDIKVVRAIGKGLDEKAIEAVKQWKFEPATRDGNPVAVAINVEVNFRLY